MKEMGITSGCGLGTDHYCPIDPARKEEMAVFANRGAQRRSAHPLYISDNPMVALDNSFQPQSTNPWFSDVPASHPFFRWIQLARDLGVVQGGCGANTFCPANAITRGEASFYIDRGFRGVHSV
jgi:hypothetical protein